MKIVINKFIPFHGFIAMMFYNIILWREEYKWLQETYKYKYIVNHESIHEAQMKDFCRWIPIGGTIFYILYFIEWIYRLLFTKDAFSHKAYSNISFEKEAKGNEKNLVYLNSRKKFAQWNKIS